ncbi:MAG: hypothetical protein DRP35_07150 [Candidatus Zixiibacteriota bacterium]|nr:MAG: hypothetical protein DRP35_07150 [candidate division Zixibacteria bacterium]
MQSIWFGSVGVFILLFAFGLNLLRKISEDSKIYLLMNIAGSGMAGIYAYASNIIPFVILEVAWMLVALVKLTQVMKKGS